MIRYETLEDLRKHLRDLEDKDLDYEIVKSGDDVANWYYQVIDRFSDHPDREGNRFYYATAAEMISSQHWVRLDDLIRIMLPADVCIRINITPGSDDPMSMKGMYISPEDVPYYYASAYYVKEIRTIYYHNDQYLDLECRL